MRIYIQPPFVDGSEEKTVSTAEKLLQESGVRAARAGRVFKGQAVILVDASEIVKARELLRAAGIRVRPDWAS